jgi:branched-chain amino acid transport system permease protein
MDASVILGAVIQGVMLGAIYGLIGLGITMVFAVTGLLNFAHGDFMSLAMYLCLALFNAFHLDPYLSLWITIPVFFGLGLLFYHYLFRRVLKAEILMVVQLTLGLMFIIENGMLMAFGPDYRNVPNFLLTSVLSIGEILFIRGTYLVTFLVGAAVGFGLYWMIESTDLGRQIRAIAQDKEAAQLMGVNVDKVQMLIFSIGIALLGLAGPLLTSILTMEPYFGMHLTLFAFITFVMGGIGNFLGTLVAGYILGVTESLGMLFFGGYYGAAVPYAMFVLLLILRPSGLLGRR